MRKPTKSRKRPPKAVRPESLPKWRITKMRAWRESRKWTQQHVSDLLATLHPPVKITRNSILRYEAGLQRPPEHVVFGIASLYGTDVHSLLEMTPEDAETLQPFRKMSPDERRYAFRVYKAAQRDHEA